MESNNVEITCIVTIHGIGFQQPPSVDADGIPVGGYGDALHMHLCDELNKNGDVLLSDDPDRQPGPPGGPGLRKRRHAGNRRVDWAFELTLLRWFAGWPGTAA